MGDEGTLASLRGVVGWGKLDRRAIVTVGRGHRGLMPDLLIQTWLSHCTEGERVGLAFIGSIRVGGLNRDAADLIRIRVESCLASIEISRGR